MNRISGDSTREALSECVQLLQKAVDTESMDLNIIFDCALALDEKATNKSGWKTYMVGDRRYLLFEVIDHEQTEKVKAAGAIPCDTDVSELFDKQPTLQE